MINKIPQTWFCTSYEQYELMMFNEGNKIATTGDTVHDKIKQLEHRIQLIENKLKQENPNADN